MLCVQSLFEECCVLILETRSCLRETLLSISKDLVQAVFFERLRLNVADFYSIIQSITELSLGEVFMFLKLPECLMGCTTFIHVVVS